MGHIHAFAALATIASAVILVHSTFVDPLIWFILRALTGFCLSGLLMIAFTLYRMSVRTPVTAEEQSQVIVAEAMDETDQGEPLVPKEIRYNRIILTRAAIKAAWSALREMLGAHPWTA